MGTRALLALCLIGLVSTSVDAQTPAPKLPWLYGVSTGLGHRSFSGTFAPPVNPSGGGVPANGATFHLDLEGGRALSSRVALMLVYSGGAAIGNGHGWGTLGGNATVRVWLTERAWIEGGAGVAQLAFRPPGPVENATTRWWGPGEEAGAAYDLFRGPTIELLVLGRYLHASIDGLQENTFSVQLGLLGRF